MNILAALVLMATLWLIGFAVGISHPLPRTIDVRGCFENEKATIVRTTADGRYITCVTKYSRREIFLENKK